MNRDWITLAFGIALVGAVLVLSLRQNIMQPAPALPAPAAPVAAPESTAPASDNPAAPAPPDAAGTTLPPPTGAAGPAPAASPVTPRNRATAPPAAAASSPVAGGDVVLQVQSDVPGASVFLDREFVGATPLTLRGLTPGRKQINVTATGHEGYAAGVDLSPGPNRVAVEFLKVRLDARLPVVHRHGMGSCQGMLSATAKGLSYDTSNKEDAFVVAFADIDEFEVEYLKKNLRVRRRAGRTWNFTNDSADALFVFHRDVSKAREKLAAR